MLCDFWNNPIVVSSVRVNARARLPFVGAGMLLALLTVAGLVYGHFRPVDAALWPSTYFDWLIVFLFFAAFSLGSSGITGLTGEAPGATLDSHRLALTPRQYLIGAFLANSLVNYQCLLATLPFGILCHALGGVPLRELLLTYVFFASLLVMIGAMTLLAPVAANPSSNQVMGSNVLLPHVMCCFYLLFAHISVYLFHFRAWYMVAMPVHLLIAWLCFRRMERKLARPSSTAFGKRFTYVLLAALDLAVVLALCATNRSITNIIASYFFIHVLMSFWMTAFITPSREAQENWIWRYQGKSHSIRERLSDEGTGTSLAVFLFCVIGTAIFVAAIPFMLLLEDCEPIDFSILVPVCTMAALVTMVHGELMQCSKHDANAGGLVSLISSLFVMGLFMVFPFVFGVFTWGRWFWGLSPLYYGAIWRGNCEYYPTALVAMTALYSYLYFDFWRGRRREMSIFAEKVAGKLQAMGISAGHFGKSIPRNSNGTSMLTVRAAE